MAWILDKSNWTGRLRKEMDRFGVKRITEKRGGMFISCAPASIVKPYAIGDVRRTKKLHEFFIKDMPTEGDWKEAYDRERKLFQVILDMEEEGVPVNVKHLDAEIKRGEEALSKTDKWIRKRLKADINVDSRPELAEAIEAADLVDEWYWTEPTKSHPEGQRIVAIDKLKEVLKDPILMDVLEYRSLLKNQISTFAIPWFGMAHGTGKIYCTWNQVRQYGERQHGGPTLILTQLPEHPDGRAADLALQTNEEST
jgi:DNA polymerase I-like protein with 3'-5' exonuclease and polymerase domains